MSYIRYHTHPILRDPVVLVAFGGWNDAADAATTAIKFLIDRWKLTKFAEIDAEEFFDFTESRPTVKFIDDFHRMIVWPSNQIFAQTEPEQTRDIILFLGVEPQLKWKTFSEAFLTFCQQFNVSEVVFLGALLADVPHSAVVPLTGTATTLTMVERLHEMNVRQSRYEGPTGMIGVLQDVCRRSEIPAASIWAAAPHYLAATPNIKVTSALLTAINTFLSFGLDLQEIQTDALRFEEQISLLVARDPEASAYVRRLEEQANEPDDDIDVDDTDENITNPDVVPGTGPLPSADTLIRGVEELLRKQRENGSPRNFDDDEEDDA